MTQVVEQLQTGPAGTVFFDATCGMCSTAARRMQRLIGPRGFALMPLQAPGVAEQLKLGPDYEDWEIKLLTPQHQVLGGADALIVIARRIWWAYPIWLASHIPGAMAVMRYAYRFVARHRRRISQVCHLRPDMTHETELPHDERLWSVDVIVALLLLAIGTGAATYMRSWQAMWTLVACVWIGFKWFMWRAQIGAFVPRHAAVGFFFGWAGTDPRPFVQTEKPCPKPRAIDWMRGVFNTLIGAALVWLIARRFYPAHPMVTGWLGMIGGVMCLHFGLFLILTVVWRANGVAVAPIMDRPIRATSVADFWSRWNLAFRDFAWTVLFRNLLRSIGFTAATVVVFFASGLIHELLISIPARGGYGLPTLYFMIQGAAVLFEKSTIGRHMRPIYRRMIMHVVLIAPLGLLFHPPFVLRVFVPFIHAIGGVP